MTEMSGDCSVTFIASQAKRPKGLQDDFLQQVMIRIRLWVYDAV